MSEIQKLKSEVVELWDYTRELNREISNERRRTCDLVLLLIKILPNRFLRRGIYWKGGYYSVKSILMNDIDP